MKKKLIISLCLLVLMTGHGQASDIPRRDNKHFYNTAESLKLPEAQVRAIESKLQDVERDYSGVQMAVLIVETLDNEAIEDFSLNVAEKWKLGRKKGTGEDVDKGLLLVVSLKDRKYRFEVGYGLEGRLPDSAVGTLGREVLAPAFRDGRYLDGIYRAIDMVRRALNDENRQPERSPEIPRLGEQRFYNTGTVMGLTDYESQQMEIRLQSLALGAGGIDMAVLAVDSLSGEPIDRFAARVAESWGMGRKKTAGREGDRGVLLVLAMKDKQYRFEVGGQIEGLLTDRLADAIGRESMVTEFLAGRYADGIYRVMDDVADAMQGTYPGSVALAEEEDNRGLWERLRDMVSYSTFSRPSHYDYVYGDLPMKDPGWLKTRPGGKKYSSWTVIALIIIAALFSIYHFLLGGAVGLIEGAAFSWLYIGHAWPILLLSAALGFVIGMASKYLAAFALIFGITRSGGGGFGGGGATGSW